jgi:hypothetical protein
MSCSCRVIGVAEKKVCFSAVFKGVKGKISSFKFNLEVGRQSYKETALHKYFSLGHKHLALGNMSCRKRRVAIQPFSKELKENFCA